MRLLVRVTMAISLIVADAAQAASLAAPQGGRAAEDQVTNYEARLQRILERDERNWRRLSASICSGCGSAPPPSDLASATPLYLRARREAVAGATEPEAVKTTSALKPVSTRSATAQREDERGRAARAKPRPARWAKARRHVRYARLRMIRHQRRLALLQAQRKRRAAAVLAMRPATHRIRLAGLPSGVLGSEAGTSGRERRPTPLPPPRPDILCADDRGLGAAGARSSTTCDGTP
jgi:hypothetical protein